MGICLECDGHGTIIPSTSPTGEADAQLIAAAPDLLSACQRLLAARSDASALEWAREVVAKVMGDIEAADRARTRVGGG